MSQMLTESLAIPSLIQKSLANDIDLYLELGERLRRLDPQFVATLARGSSDHVANYSSYLIPLCTGRLVASIPPSTFTVLNSSFRVENQLALAISQSGGSPDIVKTMQHLREQKALTVALVNDVSSPLALASEIVLPQRAETELSVAATKTVLCSMTAVARMTGEWAIDKKLLASLEALPEALRRAAEMGMTLDEHRLTGVSDVYVLSRGLGESGAREIALKLKETCGLHAEGFSATEVKHGPREIVDDRFMVIALALKGSGEQDIIETALELESQGARVIVVCAKDVLPARAKNLVHFELPEIEDHRLLPIVCLQQLFPWIAKSSNAVGRNPDRPRYLKSKLVQTF